MGNLGGQMGKVICGCFISFCSLFAFSSQVEELDTSKAYRCGISTPEDLFEYWDQLYSEEDKATVQFSTFKDLINFHFGWGSGIRRGFCLGDGGALSLWFEDRGIDHEDDMSMVLIDGYWAILNGCNPDMDAYASASYPRPTSHLKCDAGQIRPEDEPVPYKRVEKK